MATTTLERRIATVRRFNRFYTQKIGVLNEGLLRSPFSLAEARILYELCARDQTTATELGNELGLDAGYLSRILRSFEARGLVTRRRSAADARQNLLVITARGRKAFAPLDRGSRAQIRRLLGTLPAAAQNRLVAAIDEIETLLGGRSEIGREAYVLRPLQPGDLGWVVHRHGALYAREYGWDERFEALVAEIAAQFVNNYDPKHERCWIAEKDGSAVGSVFLVRHSPSVAKLRLLLVEPSARGLGIGRRLVEECVRFARRAGYKKITLWTQSILTTARAIYRRAGFRLVAKERHRSFGHSLVGETWELAL